MKLLSWFKGLLGTAIPWFVTDRVAMGYTEEEGWFVICREDELRPGEYYEVLGTARGIAFLGWNFSPTIEIDD